MDMQKYAPQLQEYPLIRHIVQALWYQKNNGDISDGILLTREEWDDDFFNLLPAVNLTAIASFRDHGFREIMQNRILIGDRDRVATIIRRLVVYYAISGGETLRVMPERAEIPCTFIPDATAKSTGSTLLNTISNGKSFIENSLYNGLIDSRGIIKPSTSFQLDAEVQCTLLQSHIPHHLAVIEEPMWSYDHSYYQGVVTSVGVDEHGNKLTGVTFRRKEGQEYLPFPMNKMNEVLYINDVLVGCPVKGPTLQLTTNI